MASKRQSGQRELVLENRQLVFIFFGAVVLCAIFFSLGFLVGREQRDWSWRASNDTTNTADKRLETSASTTSKKPLPGGPAKSTDQDAISKELTFFKSVEGKANPADIKMNPPTAAGQHDTEKPASAASRPSQEAASKPTPPILSPAAPGILIQVAALSKSTEAETLVRKLKEKGFQAFLVAPAQGSTADKLFRVQVGPFSNPTMADQIKTKLMESGYRPITKK